MEKPDPSRCMVLMVIRDRDLRDFWGTTSKSADIYPLFQPKALPSNGSFAPNFRREFVRHPASDHMSHGSQMNQPCSLLHPVGI